MSNAALLDALTRRNSAPRLTDPAPCGEALTKMLRCALRVPDHAWLRPWRFASVRGDERAALGQLMLESLLRRQPDADEAARSKAMNAPLRAPLVLVVMAAITEHPKVPAWEQRISAGCAAYSVLLAAEALGYAGIWRTGAVAEDRTFARDFGAADNEHIVGFLYLGTRQGTEKTLPALDPESFHDEWAGRSAQPER
jgi:nitroreductase